MSGNDSSSKTPDEANATPSSRTQDYPTRGIEPERPYSPPTPPDLGVGTGLQRTPEFTYSPATSAPPRHAISPWSVIAIVAAIVAVLALIIGLVVVGVGSLLSTTGDRYGERPSSGIDDSSQDDPDDARPSVESTLQATIDEYKSARDSGTLWATIPDTEYNRTAVSAFLYLLTDLKLAASFGADTSDYLQRANELEQKLLNQEPLGSDITITLSDRTFTYDGDTGEGGYTDN